MQIPEELSNRFDGKNLRMRLITGLIAAALVILLTCVSSWGLLFVCVVLSMLGLVEFFGLVGQKWYAPHVLFILLFAAGLWGLLVYGYKFQGQLLPLLPLVVLIVPISLVLMLFQPDIPAAYQALGYLLVGLIYILMPFVLLYVVAFFPEGLSMGSDYRWHVPLGILFLVWGADVGAYFAGKIFGHTYLYPRISPNKTWEGFFGGLVFALVLAYVMTQYWPFTNFSWYVMTAIVSVAGTLGDLAESMLKRNIGRKDSGEILPGHGGVLDRFDAFLLAMPCVFIYIFYCLISNY